MTEEEMKKQDNGQITHLMYHPSTQTYGMILNIFPYKSYNIEKSMFDYFISEFCSGSRPFVDDTTGLEIYSLSEKY